MRKPDTAAPPQDARLEALVAEPMLVLTPRKGGFDAAQVEAAVAALGLHFRDPVDQAIHVLSTDQALLTEFEARRRADPEARLPPTLLISVQPGQVAVARSAFEEDLPMARQFLGWLTGAYKCRIVNEDGNEVATAG